MGGGALLLGTFIDLLKSRHNLRGGAVDFLYSARKFFGCRGDFFSTLANVGAVLQFVGELRQLLRRLFALLQRLRLLLNCLGRFLAGGALLIGRRRDHLGSLQRLFCRVVRFVVGFCNFTAASCNFDHVQPDLLQPIGDFFTFRHFLLRGICGSADAFGNNFYIFLNLSDETLNVACRLLAGFGERPHLVGHDGETFAMLPGPGGFDSGVEGKQVGLIGNARNRVDDLSNRGGLALQFLDHLYRGTPGVRQLC